MTQRSTQRADKQLQTVERRRGRTWGVDKMKGLAVKAGWFIAALLLSVQVQAGTYYFHNDHLGTPQVLTDDTQTVVWKGEYDPFGKVTETVSTVEQNLRFPGQYYDQETGLHYNYFRTYDPGTGRYVESDPIGLGGGLNTYGYAFNNPLLWIDLYGLTPDWLDFLNEANLPATYNVNPKHTDGQKYQRGKEVTPLPKNHEELFDRSYADTKGPKDSKGRPMRAFSVDDNGNICRFSNDGNGNYHFAKTEKDMPKTKDKDLKRKLQLDRVRVRIKNHEGRRRRN